MDWHQIEQNWNQFQHSIKLKWVRLTDEDVSAIAGRRSRLEDSIHKCYGFSAEHVCKEIDDWLRWQTVKLRDTDDEPTEVVSRF